MKSRLVLKWILVIILLTLIVNDFSLHLVELMGIEQSHPFYGFFWSSQMSIRSVYTVFWTCYWGLALLLVIILTIVMLFEMKDFSFLKKALHSNPSLEKTVFANYPNGYLQILDELFKDLFTKSCRGIDVKVIETSPDLIRFRALVSELEFARYFLEKGMYVELLSNNTFQGRKAPDIYVKSDSKEYFIEVKNIQMDDKDYIFGTHVVELLNLQGLSFAVIINSTSSLSTPTYFFNTRAEKEKFIKSTTNEFLKKLKQIASKSPPLTITTTHADIELHQTEKQNSYLAMGTMKEAISEPSDYGKRIRTDVVEKGSKRETWIDDELDKFFIVAIDDDTLFFYLDRYNVETFGKAGYYCYPLPVPVPKVDPEIENAVNNGWEEYLKQMCILKNDRSVIRENERGLFFVEPLTKNVSAILAKHRKNYYLLPNPLADQRINSPSIFEDFKDCITGWE